MPDLDGDVLPLAEAIADGSHVDWDHAESSATSPEELRVIRQLRLLSDVGKAARESITTWGPLDIRGEVGGGAFGTVYRAWDSRLHREVALKLLKAPHRDTPLASTVVKEARLLAQIRHPNVVTVHGADVYDDRVGIWMEFVTGRTLKEMLLEHGPFGADEAVLIGRDLCRALAAVHQRGFLHRDIKAQNVMREAGGRTVLMDFGAGEAADKAGASLAGSPAYLAPEVLDGQPPTAQSDIYSLGVLLYHLVSGDFPVSAGSLDEFRAQHHSGMRRRLTDLRPDLPPSFVRAIDRATATAPADRPESAGAMEALLDDTLSARDLPKREGDLRRRPSIYRRVGTLLAAGAVTALLGVTAMQQWWSPNDVRHGSVAILPFKNAGEVPDGEYFSDGITADLAAHLATISELRVISGTSVQQFRDGPRSPVEIGAQLGVATVLDGSVTRLSDRVRISSQLFDARTGASLWSQSFDSSFEDLVSLQAEVSGQIAVALRGELSRLEAERIGKAQAQNVEAFDRYLEGRYYWAKRTEAGLQRSLQAFQAAIAIDGQYALAYSGLADAYTLLGVYGSLPRSYAFEHALAAASQAVALDSAAAEAHASLGYAQKNLMQWSAADASFKRAIELKPGYAAARHWYAILLTQLGRFPEAIAEIKTAIALDPLSPSAHGQLGATLLMARRYDDAIEQFRKLLQMQPKSLGGFRAIAQAYTFKGLFEEATAAGNQATAALPVAAENQELQGDRGYLLAVSGRADEAMAIARQLMERHDRTGEEVATMIAAIHTGLGQNDAAFEWLSRALETGEPELGYLKVEPRWDRLRDDARFSRLLGTLGFSN